MKLTRIVALAGMVALAAPAAAFAQGGGGQGGRGMQMLMQGITLTEKQKASVDSIGKVYRAQMPPMQQGTPPDSATRAKSMEVRQKQYAAVRSRPDARPAEGLRQEPRGHARPDGEAASVASAHAADGLCPERPLVGGSLSPTGGRWFMAILREMNRCRSQRESA